MENNNFIDNIVANARNNMLAKAPELASPDGELWKPVVEYTSNTKGAIIPN